MLAAAILVVCTIGCNRGHDKLGDAPRTEKTSSVAGWKDISTSGVSLRLPSDWKIVEVSKESMEKGGDAVLGNDPKFATLRAQAKQIAKQGLVKLIAFETSTVTSGFATNCNVAIQDMTLPLTLEQVAGATLSQIAPVVAAGTQPKIEYPEVPSGKLALIRSEIKPPNLATSLASLAYLRVKGQRLAIITFTAPQANEEHIRGIAKQAMDDFKFE
jgi:hypothetical protein